MRPRGPWPVNLATQDRDFMPQHQQLGSDCGLAARQDRQPPEQAHHDQIEESQNTRPTIMPDPHLPLSRRSTGVRRVLEQYWIWATCRRNAHLVA
jgi:hypothetical protein